MMSITFSKYHTYYDSKKRYDKNNQHNRFDNGYHYLSGKIMPIIIMIRVTFQTVLDSSCIMLKYIYTYNYYDNHNDNKCYITIST